MEYSVNDIQKREISYKLKQTNESIVKNLYQIYNILFQTKKVITRNQDFNKKNIYK